MGYKESSIINPFLYITKQIRKIYLKSNIYNTKISKVFDGGFEYIPHLKIFDCIVKVKDRKNRIEDYNIESIWENQNLSEKDFKKLHSFFWLFTIDLKSSKKITRSVIFNWTNLNQNYSLKSWEINTLSKRVISWIANSNNFYHEGDQNFKINFTKIIKKQLNHLINEIENTELVNDKMIGCSAIIIGGLCFKHQMQYLNIGFQLLKKIINTIFDNDGFPKSRSPRQVIFYLKYFVFIRELLKDSNTDIPEFLNEIIFYLGQSFIFYFEENEGTCLFNGNHNLDTTDFKKYIKEHGYKFKNKFNSVGGYSMLKNKKDKIIVDFGSTPDKKYSADYQSGALSFEIFHDKEKVITNCGYFQDYKHKLNILSKSTAAHSTLSIDDRSSCKFKKNKLGHFTLENTVKITNKKIYHSDEIWEIQGAHDGYLKEYGILHQRNIQFFPKEFKYVGEDIIICKKKIQKVGFDIRFHLMPATNAIKTQDKLSILLQLKKSGWRFTCNHNNFGIETGLYFGKKDSYTENKNIYINGEITKEEEKIKWEIRKI